MINFLLFFSILFSTSKVNQSDNVLQIVLDLSEVQSYFERSPRLSSSKSSELILLKHSDVTLEHVPTINSRKLKVLDSENFSKENLMAYLQLELLQMNGDSASIKLIIQNAELLQEENSQILLSAELNRIGEQWQIATFKEEKINISY